MHLSQLGTGLNMSSVDIGHLHSQPFTNSHFHFITAESATSQVLHQRPRQMEVRQDQVRAIGT
jgi:hypothetical protein